MRRAFLVIALLSCAQFAWGDEKAAQDEGNQTQQPAAQAQQDKKDAGESQPQTVNKPVIDERQLAEAGQREPLHRHPILQRMLVRNNQMRGGVGLRSHRIDPALTKAAQDHANYMARTRDFSHYSNLGPSGRAQKYGFPYGVRENIAYGYPTVDAAFAGWQASGGHWANMTSGTTDAGFGYAVSPDGTAYWVAVYGNAPVSDEAVVDGMPAETDSNVRQASAEDPVPPGANLSALEGNAATPAYNYSSQSGRRRLIFRNR
ncbi:MAG: CAP domain-containing protein [Pirellulales bacterium]